MATKVMWGAIVVVWWATTAIRYVNPVANREQVRVQAVQTGVMTLMWVVMCL